MSTPDLPDTAQAADEYSPSTPSHTSNGETNTRRPRPQPDDDPRRPALYRQPRPQHVPDQTGAHDLVADSLYSLDGKVLKQIKADRYRLLRMLGRDLEDRRDLGLATYGIELQPGNGRVAIIDMYQEDLDGLAYAETELIEQQGSPTEPDARALYEAHLTTTLLTRAYLARMNGELPGGATTPAGA